MTHTSSQPIISPQNIVPHSSTANMSYSNLPQKTRPSNLLTTGSVDNLCLSLRSMTPLPSQLQEGSPQRSVVRFQHRLWDSLTPSLTIPELFSHPSSIPHPVPVSAFPQPPWIAPTASTDLLSLPLVYPPPLQLADSPHHQRSLRVGHSHGTTRDLTK